MSVDLNTINAQLFAKTKNQSAKNQLVNSQEKAQDAYAANNLTVLGQDAQQKVNGFLSLDNNPISSISPDQLSTEKLLGSTASSLTQIMPDSIAFPSTDPKDFNIDLSIGGVSEQLNINQSITSLTGIVPPDESISIVSLGGAAVDELTSSIKVAAERKNSLLSEIQSVASEVSVEGISGSVLQGIKDITETMTSTIKDSELLKKVTESVSAVENLGNSVANAAATATNNLVSSVNSTIGQVTSAIDDKFKSVIGAVNESVGNLINDITPDIKIGTGSLQDLFEDLTGSVTSSLQGLFGSSTDLSKSFISDILQDVAAGGDINLSKASKKLSLRDASLSADMKSVIRNTEAESISELNAKVTTRASAKGIPKEQIDQFIKSSADIENVLNKINTTISGTIISEVGSFYTEDTDLAELVKRYLGSETKIFEYVDSKEELGLEFYKINRPISEIIIHATETYTNANIGSEEIHLRHNEAGHNGIQYHYVIRRDGRIQRGMPLDDVSDASNILGHNLNCVDVALVGGVNVPSEADNPLLNLSSSSFTQVQMKSLESLLEIFYQRNPGGQVLGHNAIDNNSPDPYFDVIAFVQNRFNKRSVYKDPLTENSISSKDLINKRPV